MIMNGRLPISSELISLSPCLSLIHTPLHTQTHRHTHTHTHTHTHRHTVPRLRVICSEVYFSLVPSLMTLNLQFQPRRLGHLKMLLPCPGFPAINETISRQGGELMELLLYAFGKAKNMTKIIYIATHGF